MDFFSKAIDISRGISTTEVRKNFLLVEKEEIRLKNFAYFPGALLLFPIYAVFDALRGRQTEKWDMFREIIFNRRKETINNLVMYQKTRSIDIMFVPNFITKGVMAVMSTIVGLSGFVFGLLIYMPIIYPLHNMIYGLGVLFGFIEPKMTRQLSFWY